MINVINKKKYVCFLCGHERTGNIDSGVKVACDLCVLRLYNTPAEKIKTLYDKFIEKGMIEKAEIIKCWLPKEKEEDIEYEKFNRNLERTGSHRKVSFTKQRWEKPKGR